MACPVAVTYSIDEELERLAKRAEELGYLAIEECITFGIRGVELFATGRRVKITKAQFESDIQEFICQVGDDFSADCIYRLTSRAALPQDYPTPAFTAGKLPPKAAYDAF